MPKTAKQLKTYAEFKAYVIALLAKHNDVMREPTSSHKDDDEAMMWFAACLEAENYSELRTKDIASILLVGLPRLSKKSVVGWLEQFYDNEHFESYEAGGHTYEGKTLEDAHKKLDHLILDHFKGWSYANEHAPLPNGEEGGDED